MGMAAKDSAQDANGDYRRGISRKPPRPHSRRRRCVSEDVRGSGGGSARLTTFQKLDREMDRFVKQQQQQQDGNQHENASSLVQVVSGEESCSVRGVRRGVKWKCGWMFEQDSLYWETGRRHDLSLGDQPSWRQAHDTASSDSSSSSATTLESGLESGLDCDESMRKNCSTDPDSVSSGLEMRLRRSHASSRRNRARGVKRVAPEKSCGREEGWPAVLKAKCEVLQMEKELADQRLRQHSAGMAQAAEMAHSLRASVQTILETAKKGTVSAPCTPGRNPADDYLPCLQQRIQRLPTGTGQRDMEEQARSFQNRIDNLRLQSQIRSRCGDSSVSKTRLSSTSSTTQVLTSDGEDWAQVQEVLKQLRGKTGSLQYTCENWEKRAIFSESKAASLQIEEERWRVAAQKSEEKVRELEKELVQVRATLEEVRNRHALEQSRLLGSGSNHAYTLVLQPIVTSNASCRGSLDCESCSHCHISTSSGHHQPAAVSDVEHQPDDAASFENCVDICDDPVSDQAASPTEVHSPERDAASEATTVSTGQARHRYDGVQEDDDSQTPTKPEPRKDDPREPAQETSKTETEKSLSQKWFKQRPKSRRPGTPSSEMSMSETRSNLGNSPIPRKVLQRKGNAQKPGPVYAGSTRVSPPSHLEKRVALRELKRNALCAPGDAPPKSECS